MKINRNLKETLQPRCSFRAGIVVCDLIALYGTTAVTVVATLYFVPPTSIPISVQIVAYCVAGTFRGAFGSSLSSYAGAERVLSSYVVTVLIVSATTWILCPTAFKNPALAATILCTGVLSAVQIPVHYTVSFVMAKVAKSYPNLHPCMSDCAQGEVATLQTRIEVHQQIDRRQQNEINGQKYEISTLTNRIGTFYTKEREWLEKIKELQRQNKQAEEHTEYLQGEIDRLKISCELMKITHEQQQSEIDELRNGRTEQNAQPIAGHNAQAGSWL